MTDPQGGQNGSREAGDPCTGESESFSVAINAFHGTYKTVSDESSKHAKKSLKWTAATGVAAWFYTILTAALLSAGIYSAIESTEAVHQASRAADEAKRGADAASSQSATAQDTEKRQLRAYVGLIPPPDNQVSNNFTPPATPLIRLTPKNFGVTPAYEAIHKTGMQVGYYPLAKNFEYPIQELATPPNPITIYPGAFDLAGIQVESLRALTQDEIASIQDGKTKRLYVWGTLTYKDVFREPHYTNFCLGFYNLTPTQVQREPCNEHNDSN